jgi:AraC-like DNA-binding protein
LSIDPEADERVGRMTGRTQKPHHPHQLLCNFSCSGQYRRQAHFNAAKAAPVASTTPSAPARCSAPCAVSSRALGPPVADRRTDYLIWSLRPKSDLREFERFYGCRVEFGVSSDQLAFSNETLAVPLVTEDRYLLKTLRPICDEAARKRGTQKGTLRAAVENEVQKLLPQGKVRKETIAKSLGLGVRTLLRRLSYEGTSYAEVVDQLRRSLALQYGNHAFRRWTGRSPSTVRAAGGLLVHSPLHVRRQ